MGRWHLQQVHACPQLHLQTLVFPRHLQYTIQYVQGKDFQNRKLTSLEKQKVQSDPKTF